MLTAKVNVGDELAEVKHKMYERVRVARVTKYITLDDGRMFLLDGTPHKAGVVAGHLEIITSEVEAAIQEWHDCMVITNYSIHNKWSNLPPSTIRRIVEILEEETE
jgi:hypothetical protein